MTYGDYQMTWRSLFVPIRKAKKEFNDMHHTTVPPTKQFIEWLDETYGVQLSMAKDGHHLSDHLTISDEKKYMFFVLKYKS